MKTVLVDFDGTIAHYEDGWQGDTHLGRPLESAKELLSGLKTRGFEVCIYTTRCTATAERSAMKSRENKVWIENWLRRHGLVEYVDRVLVCDKPLAAFLVDDRAIRFRGEARITLAEIDEFQPWWEERDTRIDATLHEDEEYPSREDLVGQLEELEEILSGLDPLPESQVGRARWGIRGLLEAYYEGLAIRSSSQEC